ncbi:MAG: hypothetical protein NZ553_07620, partial [Caldilinea sp.]|nr:hypothetical protein [Caldilinea sp.]MDW8440324.1 hypothetical protein [Caldilineaceae bacterium]
FDLVKAEKLIALAQKGEFWWIERTNGAAEWAPAAMNLFARPDVYRVDAQHLDGCKLVRAFLLDDARPLGVFKAASGQIALRSVRLGEAKPGATLPLVLYWQAMTSIEDDYTVFTQLFAPDGRMVAQQDNPPMLGQAPTGAWRVGELVRDAYRLTIPADAAPGAYKLHIGLYNQAGRLPVTLQDGAIGDHVTIDVTIDVEVR